MPVNTMAATRSIGRRPKKRQGTKSRSVVRRRCGARYGNPFARSRVLPILPQPTDAEWAAVPHGDGVGLLGLSFDRLPLEEVVNRDDTTARAIGVAEHRQLLHGLIFWR
jgi:hypothetical protein